MDLNQMTETVKKLHPGASYVVVYKKEMPTTDGSAAYKITHKPCRLGVRYGNLKENKGRQVGPLPGNGHWVIDKFVYQDNNGYKLRITNGAFGQPSSTYYGDLDKIVIAKKEFVPKVQSIKLENVLAILRKGEAV